MRQACLQPAVACTLLLVSTAAAAADEPRVWLQRMSQALELLSYEGNFVHGTGDMSQNLRVVHKVNGNRVSERLIALDGANREIIRDNGRVKCIFENERAVHVGKRVASSPLRTSLPNFDGELEAYYTFALGGTERIMQHDTQIIAVRPRDDFRYGYRLWLDEATAMPLRFEVLGPADDLVEYVLFSSIMLDGEIPDSALEQETATDENFVLIEGAASSVAADEVQWEASELPQGFKLSVTNTQQVAENAAKSEHHVYTDGIASVSVFVESSTPPAAALKGLSTMGAANAFATTIDGHQVTVIGEVPANTVELIGNAMTRRAAKRR
ncbi:MAG: MucB/RseB C-terminal domain-containing protein [Pseudomonadota bacterium]